MRKKAVWIWIFIMVFCLQTIPAGGAGTDLTPAAASAASAPVNAPDTAVDGANPTLLISSPVETVNKAATVTKNMADANADTVMVNARSAVLMDVGTGSVLYEKNAHDKLPPASVTKVMTMLLVMEAIEAGQITMQDMVTISPRAASMGGSQLYMEVGEQQSVETLMKGIAVASANDACVAMAEYVGGTEGGFVDMMNQKAAELGMKETNFVNTNGLPVPNHYASAYDIGLMSKELLKYDEPKKWFAIWTETIQVGIEGKPKTDLGITNTNKLIRTYPGANGVKTGFTQEAGYCLSGSASKGDLTLIAVIMGAPSSKIRFDEAARLLDYGFALYDSVPIAKKGETVSYINISKGQMDEVKAVAPENIDLLVKKGEKNTVKTENHCEPMIAAPIQKGQQVGEMILYQNGREVARYPLIADQTVEKAGFLTIYIKMIQSVM